MMRETGSNGGLKDIQWRISYHTSTLKPDGKPIDILHDFYIPALRRSVHYDRVAGFFRSTSLAVATQGFSAFVGQKGKMRMIVGADLHPDDVRAILLGTEDRLTKALNAELEGVETWPEEVVRGVELLAWMVSNGYLEVRVAFRVHSETRDPLPVESVADGYVHMKWALFKDRAGNRIYISGSLNESRTALCMNAENIDVHCDWRGGTESLRVEEAEREFEFLWQDRNPAMRVLSLPEAVKKRLVKIAEGVINHREIDGSSAIPRKVSPPSTMERLRFSMIWDGPRLPGGRYVGMETAPVTPWPHQAVVARRLIATWPLNYLLCDEVGLGKTIEAGLAIRSLYLSGIARRILICAPASLTRQWHREMASKFFLPFGRALTGAQIRHEYLLPFSEERQGGSIYESDLTILSTGLLTRKERANDLKKANEFDMVLVDEAHYARRSNPTLGTRGNPEYGRLWKGIHQGLMPKAKCLLLATATPMQLDPVEASDLSQLTRRVGAFQLDPGLTRAYYEALGQLVSDQPLPGPEWQFVRRAVKNLERQDPFHWSFIQKAVVDGRSRLAVRQWLEAGRIPRGADLRGVLRLIFTAAPLSRVMLRHTRSLLEVYRHEGQLGANLAKRHILPVQRIVMTVQERDSYDQMEEYCRGLSEQLAGHGDNRARGAVGFMLSFLRLRFASSLFAIKETLRRRLGRVEETLRRMTDEEAPETEIPDLVEALDESEDDADAVGAVLKGRTPEDLEWEKKRLKPMLTTLADLSGPSSKMTELLRFLQERRISGTGRIKQTVIFTRFYDTLTDIVDRLMRVDPGMLIGTYSGEGGQYLDPRRGRLMGVERDQIKHRFLRKEIDVLVCTDAAAEGLNLQVADALVNFDLPWNPMKVEQRIGRIDRIGQEHGEIFVLNLCYADSTEQIVYDRLLRRLAEAGAVVGSQQMSLLPITREEFQELAEKRLTSAELEKRALERAFLAKRRTESMEIPARELYEIYMRLSEQADQARPPIDLDGIWEAISQSVYLRDLGCRVAPDAEQRLMKIEGVPDIPDGTMLTASRELYERGLPGEEPIHFAAYGDPVFDTLLDYLRSFELPACIRRVAVDVPETGSQIVGYAAVAMGSDGVSRPRLVSRMQDLQSQVLDEAQRVSEEDETTMRQTLAQIVNTELQVLRAAGMIMGINEEAARTQETLALLVAGGLIHERQASGQADPLFWKEIAALEGSLEDAEEVRARLPAEQARRLRSDLFDLFIPETGQQAYLDAPRPLLQAAIDAAHRLANGMKIKKSELTTDDFLAKLGREVERVSQA